MSQAIILVIRVVIDLFVSFKPFFFSFF